MMKELTGLHRGDAAIAGSGLTGLLLASSLAQAGMRVLLLDMDTARLPADDVCSGTVLCSAAYQRIATVHGPDTARTYAAALCSQLTEMLSASQPYVMSLPASLYACTDEELPMLSARQELLQTLGISSVISSDTGSCPFPVQALLTVPHQALVDMAQWRAALLQNLHRLGAKVFSSTPITSVESRRLCTAHGCAEAPVIVFAGELPPLSQGPAHPFLPERRVLALRALHSPLPVHGILLSLDGDGFSLFPSSHGAVARWDAGRCGARRQQSRLQAFDAALSACLPEWQQDSACCLYETVSLDGLPLIGHLPGSRHLFAAGTGDAGILGAMLAAAVLSRRLTGHCLPEDHLYAPDRPLPGWFIRRARQQRSVFRFQSLLRRSAPACSCCRCRMRYNIALANWECPYCGSVFNLLGQVIYGPAMHGTPLSARQRPDW